MNLCLKLRYQAKVSSSKIKLRYIIDSIWQDIKVSNSGLFSKDGTDPEVDKEEECHSCDEDIDDFDLWKYCLKLGPEWHSEVHYINITLHYRH